MHVTPHARTLFALGAATTFLLDLHALTAADAGRTVALVVTRVADPAEPAARRLPVARTRPPGPPMPVRGRPVQARRTVRPLRRPPAARVAAARVVRVVQPPAPAGPTQWADLNRAIARIPTYDGKARWIVRADDGHWGTAIWESATIMVGPRVPVRYLYDVAVHEWSHLLSLRPYGGDQHIATAEMNRVFGGTGLIGAERAADCMARLQGASWTNYTSCADPGWRAAAARLMQGRRLVQKGAS